MALIDYIDALPEDKREAFKAEAAKYVSVQNEADAERFAESNEFLRKANQKYRDPKIQEFKDKFLKEDVPKLLEAERAKGQKKDWEIEIENLKKENETAKRESALEKQKSRALAKASELGIPVSLVDKFVGLTDEETDAGLKFLADTVLPYRKSAVDEALKSIGKQPPPQGGGNAGNDLSKMSMTELNEYAKRGPEQQAEVIALAKQRK